MPDFRPLLAHQGGWDEILLFGIPVVIALVAVRIVERRTRRRESREDQNVPAEPDRSSGT